MAALLTSPPDQITMADRALDVEISLIKPSDFQGSAEMLADAFSDKQGRCCCAYICSRNQAIKDRLKAFEHTQRLNPGKLLHTAVVHDVDGSILGYCALQMQGDVGNPELPESLQHKLQPGEVYLEQIGVSARAQGKGIGKKLMTWAHEVARESGARFITLEVMNANRAKGLYERQGYVVTAKPEGETCVWICVTRAFVWSFMGCRYCRFSYMVKSLE